MKVNASILGLFFLLLSGCAIIPVPTAEHNFCRVVWAANCQDFATRGEITDQTLEFMCPGTTTREETVLNLGGPDLVWHDETIFAYHWFMVGGYVFWAWSFGVPGSGGGSSGAWFKEYVLLVEFDAHNVVKRCVVKPGPIGSGFIEEWVGGAISEASPTCDREV